MGGGGGGGGGYIRVSEGGSTEYMCYLRKKQIERFSSGSHKSLWIHVTYNPLK